MRRALLLLVASTVVLRLAVNGAAAANTWKKINWTRVFTVGGQTASPPFGFMNEWKEWAGFVIDLATPAQESNEKK